MIHELRISDLPPSANRCLRYVGGKPLKSAEYRAWLEAAMWELRSQNMGFSHPAYWRADILIPGRSGFDLDNHCKPIFDALHQARKTPDDRYLCDLRFRFHPGDHIAIATTTEDTAKWATIRNASKSLTRKLERSAR